MPVKHTHLPEYVSCYKLCVYILTCLTLSDPMKTYCAMIENTTLLLSVSRPAKTCVVTPLNLNLCLMFLLALQDINALDFKQFLLKW